MALRRRLGWGAAAVIAAGIAAAVAVGRSDGRSKPGAKPDVTLEFLASEVVTPARAPMPVILALSGPLVAPQTAVVRARAGGTLLVLRVAEGERVRAGQVIGNVELAELAARLSERNAMLESARAQLAQAERTHASNQGLADRQFISPIALEQSRLALDTARAQLRATQAQLDTLQAGWRDAALVAPIGGVVAKRHVVAGEKLAAEQPVATIVDLARLELAASVGTHEVALLEPGMAVQVQVEGAAHPVPATLARIAPAAEAGTRSIGVTIAIDNPGERLRAGQYAIARVVLPDTQQRLTLPESALGSHAGQEHVWAIEGGALVRRSVVTGRRDAAGGRVEVLQGLAPDAQVLAARYDNLREGAKATVVTTTAPVASGAASANLQ